METTSACGAPAVLYRVDSPAPLSETQKGDVEEDVRPQGFTRFESKNLAVCTTPLASVSVGTPLTVWLTTRSVSIKPRPWLSLFSGSSALAPRRQMPMSADRAQ